MIEAKHVLYKDNYTKPRSDLITFEEPVYDYKTQKSLIEKVLVRKDSKLVEVKVPIVDESGNPHIEHIRYMS